MRDDRIPIELRYQLEDGAVLGTCDWGFCDREQVGWACSEYERVQGQATTWRKPDPGWLPICAECAAGNFPVKNTDPHPVDRFVSYWDVETAEARHASADSSTNNPCPEPSAEGCSPSVSGSTNDDER